MALAIDFTPSAGGDALAVAALETDGFGATIAGLNSEAREVIARAAEASRFTGAAGQLMDLLAPAGFGARRVVIVGLGKPAELNALAYEAAGAHVVKKLLTSGVKRLAMLGFAGDGAAGAESAARAGYGAELASHRFDVFRTRLKPDQTPTLAEIEIATPAPEDARAAYARLAAVASGVAMARELVSLPPNLLDPPDFAMRLEALRGLGVDVTVLDAAAMRALGMGALLGVAQGSVKEPRLVAMHWRGAAPESPTVALIGKGVCFDTGGISIKPSANMDEMKGDMGGAAAVAGAMRALAARKAKANVVGVVALVENMPDGNAQRPGDIVTSMSGQTIEVLNTDAEGRLILCDAMWWTQENYRPKAMIDLATLTGAIIIALGHEYAGLFANDDALAGQIASSAAAENEPVWRMPLLPAYDKLIDSPNADMKNISGKSGAGSITAAQFLKRFVQDGVAWAHLDIAGTAWKGAGDHNNPTVPLWATGYGVRLLDRFVADHYEA